MGLCGECITYQVTARNLFTGFENQRADAEPPKSYELSITAFAINHKLIDYKSTISGKSMALYIRLKQ